jgi:hypothetical protein
MSKKVTIFIICCAVVSIIAAVVYVVHFRSTAPSKNFIDTFEEWSEISLRSHAESIIDFESDGSPFSRELRVTLKVSTLEEAQSILPTNYVLQDADNIINDRYRFADTDEERKEIETIFGYLSGDDIDQYIQQQEESAKRYSAFTFDGQNGAIGGTALYDNELGVLEIKVSWS